MGTQVGIIYGTSSLIIRRIVIPDDDGTLNNHVGPGESLLTVTLAEYQAASGPKLNAVATLFQQKLGRPPGDPRCAVINPQTQAVEAIIAADPAIDSVPGKTLSLNATAAVGDIVNIVASPPA